MKTLREAVASINAAHDALSDVLENPNAGNDEVRDAAVAMCDALTSVDAANVLVGVVDLLSELPNMLECGAGDSDEAGYPGRASNMRKAAALIRTLRAT